MIANSRLPKSCGPQRLDQPPEKDWDLDSLARYSRGQRERIDNSERSLSILYWRLGAALTFARRHFHHGQWLLYLDELGIERTRASKSLAIFQTFPSEEFLQGVSVEDAYQQRARKQRPSGKRRRSRKRPCSGNPTELLCELCNHVVDLQFQVAEMSFAEAEHLLPLVEAAQSELKRLRERLKARSGDSA